MGAWIEMPEYMNIEASVLVAPLVGAWIEMRLYWHIDPVHIVAPLVGAWIEIATALLVMH